MDRGAKIILAAALAIIYPLMIYFGTALAIPDQKRTVERPVQPTCDRYAGYSTYGSPNTSPEKVACENEWDEYYDAQDAYFDETYEHSDENRKTAAYRAIAMLVIAVFTLIGSIKIDIKELAGGLVIGSASMVTFSVLYISFQLDTLPFTQLIHLLIVGTFIAMTFFLKYIEDSYPQSPSPPQKPTIENPPAPNSVTPPIPEGETPVDATPPDAPFTTQTDQQVPPAPQTAEPWNEEQPTPPNGQ